MTLGFSALEPAPAQAWIIPGLPSPGQVISGLFGAIGNVIGGTVGKVAVTAFDAIIHALFAPIAQFINTQLLGWLVAVPDYARAGSHVAATEQTVLAMAGAALGAVATISIARFWVAGLAGSGGSALEGLARTVGAALLLPIWPWVFHTAVALANDASTGLLGSGSVTKSSANLLAVGVGAGVGLGFLGVGLFVSIVMAVVASVLFLGLLMMKVVLAISTVLVFIGMPIAIVLSPVVSWIPRVLARAFCVCLAVPLIWAVCFAASGAMLNDGLFLKGSSGFFNALLEPLAAIAMLWLMLLLPSKLAQMAMLGAGAVSGGFVSRAVSYAAGSQMRDAARQHMPGWAGGHGGSQRSALAGDRLSPGRTTERRERAGRQQGRERRRRRRALSRAVAAGVASASSRSGASNGTSDGSAEPRLRLAATRPRCGQARARTRRRRWRVRQGAVAASGGLQRPSWRQEDFDAEMLEASLREQRQPVSAGQARQALDALPAPTQGAVQSLVADHGPRARQHLAYQALGEWTPEQREAIRTLAAASPEVRAQAFSDGGDSTAGFGESAEPAAGSAPQEPDAATQPRPHRPAARPAMAGTGPGRAHRRTNPDPMTGTAHEPGPGASRGEAAVRLGLHRRADRGDGGRDPDRVRVGELAEPDPRDRRGRDRRVCRRAAGRGRVRRLADRVRSRGRGALRGSLASRRRAVCGRRGRVHRVRGGSEQRGAARRRASGSAVLDSELLWGAP